MFCCELTEIGVMMCPFELTKDGYENQFQSNHLSHFLLTLLLTPQLKAAGNARVVNVASEGHQLTINGTAPEVIAQIHDPKEFDKSISCKWI
jgi:NAD(P)-dependent dehydrogenase (short-subunit alcohol dehydrogenase family)